MADREISESVPSTPGGSAKGEQEHRGLSKLQAAVARRVAEAKATIPHGYAARQVEIREGASRPVTLIAALAAALVEHRGLNASYRDGGIVRYSRTNLGFLVETPQGALVPTLFDADKMTMEQISEGIEQLRGRAEAGALTAPELAGATFTAAVVGAGADAVAGVVAPGQVGHLSVGREREAAVSDDGEVRPATVLDLTLSFDQRAVRPAEAAAFLGTLAARFEGR